MSRHENKCDNLMLDSTERRDVAKIYFNLQWNE